MARKSLSEIEEILREERVELFHIEKEVDILNRALVERTPTKFSWKDVARSFFGALFVSFSFVLKGAMVSTAVLMTHYHVFALMATSIIILTAEIYYFGYRKIKNKHERRLGQFIAKRLPTSYLTALLVSAGLIYLYGINNNPLVTSTEDILKVIVAISFPAAVGAGFSDIMKQYQ